MSTPGAERFRTGGAHQRRLTGALLAEMPGTFAPGATLGVWCIEHLIARGGMSEVYRASRTGASFEQTVALKIVAAGPEQNERLREERRLLARLQHPGIAGLIDGGELDDGRAWFAMEYVEGQALDEYVVERRVPWATRIELFEALCAAVMYAHVHLLVHRDIKPGNVMVDAGGRLRLLDFGIAIPAQAGSAAVDGYMTPGFAAPEQLLGSPITTATDIYQLGETLRRVTLESPDQPALRWPKLVRVGLEAIVRRATATHPGDRYDSVARLREDLGALRQYRAVSAMSGGLRYRLGLLIRRHPRSTVLLGVAVLVALLSALSIARSMAREAEERRLALREEQTAGAIGNLFVEVLNDPNAREGGLTSMLDRGQQRLLSNEATAPETRAALLQALALANVRMERPETARAMLVEAIELQRGLGAGARSDLALSLAALARIDFLSGADGGAMPQAAEALQLLESGAPSSHAHFLALVELGELHVNALKFKEADALLERALALGTRRYGAGSAQLFNVRRLQLGSLMNQWQVARVIPLAEALVDECSRLLGNGDATCIVEATNLARFHAYAGQLTRAEASLRQLLVDSVTWTGKWRVYRIHAVLYDLAETLWLQGRLVEARRTLEDSLVKLEEAQGAAGGLHWLSDRGALALLLLDMGDVQRALEINLERPRPQVGEAGRVEDHFWVVRQALFERANGQYDERTLPGLAEAVRSQSITYGERSYFASRARQVYALVLADSGQLDLAGAVLADAAQFQAQGVRLHEAELLAEIDMQKADLARRTGKPELVPTLQAAALARLSTDLHPLDHPFRASVQSRILLSRTTPLSDSDRAALQKCADALSKHHVPESPLLKAVRERLGQG